jgi:hypothetical protein
MVKIDVFNKEVANLEIKMRRLHAYVLLITTTREDVCKKPAAAVNGLKTKN